MVGRSSKLLTTTRSGSLDHVLPPAAHAERSLIERLQAIDPGPQKPVLD